MEGWMTVDIENADIIMDLSAPADWKPLPTTDEILASHVLEHFTREQGKIFLQKCFDKLEEGGVIHIALPDMDKFVDCQLKQNWEDVNNYFWKDANYFYGGDSREPNIYMRHKYAYCFASLAWTLQEIGFTNIQREEFSSIQNPQHRAFSLYVSATRPIKPDLLEKTTTKEVQMTEVDGKNTVKVLETTEVVKTVTKGRPKKDA
jgi:predicted SAM-dependent methyltransferase